jgi:hypothetical protein
MRLFWPFTVYRTQQICRQSKILKNYLVIIVVYSFQQYSCLFIVRFSWPLIFRNINPVITSGCRKRTWFHCCMIVWNIWGKKPCSSLQTTTPNKLFLIKSCYKKSFTCKEYDIFLHFNNIRVCSLCDLAGH